MFGDTTDEIRRLIAHDPPFISGTFADLLGRKARLSSAGCALGFDVERIDRLARRHEESIALEPAETHIGAALE